VGQHQPQLGRIAPLHAEESQGIGIVEPRHLFRVEVQQQRRKIERIGQEAEEPVGGLHARDALGRELLFQLVDQIGTDLLPGAHGGPGGRAEGEPCGALHRGDHAVHELLQVVLSDGTPRHAPAGRQNPEEEQGGEGEGAAMTHQASPV